MRSPRGTLIVVVLAAGFGATVQYLASRPGLEWAVRIAGLSAPWLLVPFLAGVTQVERRRAGRLGLAATFAALTGYFAMMWSPLEGVDVLHAHLPRLLASQLPWIVGGVGSGFLFGVLGCEWRLRRTLRSGLAIAGAFCLEPLAIVAFHRAFAWVPMLGGFGTGYRLDAAAAIEIGVGLLLAGAVYAARRGPQAAAC